MIRKLDRFLFPALLVAAPALAAATPIGDHVRAALDAQAAAQRGVTWNDSADNTLANTWLVQTPVASHWDQPYGDMTMPVTCTGGNNCDADFGLRICDYDNDCGDHGRCRPLADTEHSMCVGHSDALLDRIHDLVRSGRTAVDITSLTPPDGRFVAALRRAIATIADPGDGPPVKIRLLFGEFPSNPVKPRAVIAALRAGLPDDDHRVTIQVGTYHNGATSWNHGKLIAVDGRVALVGGHNMWTNDYLNQRPVHDLSMQVSGTAALDAHRFADALWTWSCAHRTTFPLRSLVSTWPADTVDGGCDARSLPDNFAAAGDGQVRIISMGRLGGWSSRNAADTGLVALIASTPDNGTLDISQQMFSSDSGWTGAAMAAVADALVRGVNVRIIVSNPRSQVGAIETNLIKRAKQRFLGYDGTDPADVIATLKGQVESLLSATVAEDQLDHEVADRMCNLRVGRLRNSQHWDEFDRDGGGLPGNHTKLVLVRGGGHGAFYIGSQNLYSTGPGQLAEYGYVVDDTAAAGVVAQDYWTPLWTASGRTALRGTPDQQCQ